MMLRTIFARDRLLLFFAAPMAFVSPVLSTFYALQISPLAPGAITFLLLTIGAGCIAGLAAAWLCGLQGTWKLAYVLVMTLIILITMDLSVLGQKVLMEISAEPLVQTAIGLSLFLIVFGIVWLIQKNIPVLIFVVSVSILLTTLAQSSAQASERKTSTIYIIMDEMIGLNGIDRSIPGGQEAYDLSLKVFGKHGFKIYSRAFSRHFFTKVSIPAILNFDENEDGIENSRYTDNEEKLTVIQNALFKGFADQGAPITVFESGHINYCTSQVAECHVFPSFNAESRYTEHIDADVVRKANIGVIRSIYMHSYFMAPLLPFFSEAADEPDMDDHPAYFDLHGFNKWFDEFSQKAAAVPPGSLIFAHFLMPHGPSILNEKCMINSSWESPYYLKEQKELAGEDFERKRIWFYQLYFKQMQCGLKKLDRLLTMVEENPDLVDLTIVVHGDHGSRISSGKFAENNTPRDLVDNFSAFYAIRKPGLQPGVDDQSVSVQRLTKLHFSGKETAELGDFEQSVMMHSLATPSGLRFPLPEMP